MNHAIKGGLILGVAIGVINLISRTPGEEIAGRLQAGIGNYGFREASLSVEGPLVPGVLSGRVGAVYQENSDGFFANNAFQIIGESVAGRLARRHR